MVVRVKLKIRALNGGLIKETSALVNAGYESSSPEIVIPTPLAKLLKLKQASMRRSYRSLAGGRKASIRFLPKGVEVTVMTQDREEGPVKADVVILQGEEEVMISDKLIDALKIEIVSPGKGIWRFNDEPMTKIRLSMMAEPW